MSEPNVVSDPGARSGLGNLSHEVGKAGLRQETPFNPIPPLLCRVPGRLVSLLVESLRTRCNSADSPLSLRNCAARRIANTPASNTSLFMPR